MVAARRVHLAEAELIDDQSPDSELLEGICANPRCDERLVHSTGPGRRAKFHSLSCRRESEATFRRLQGRHRHYQSQADQLQRQLASYADENVEATDALASPDIDDKLMVVAQVAVARAEALVEVVGAESDDKWLNELRRLVRAVAPIAG